MRAGPTPPLMRLVIGFAGLAGAFLIVFAVAYAGPILRWQAAMLDRIATLFS